MLLYDHPHDLQNATVYYYVTLSMLLSCAKDTSLETSAEYEHNKNRIVYERSRGKNIVSIDRMQSEST